ncbi:MAG: DUF1365 domain-containing protein [Planctomycetes bacterium]|nr:DUF1365 domain-containing protein [Planctomycetota bacterium]
MKSALYFGRVAHARRGDVEHGFSYRVGFLYVDLAETDELFRGRALWRHGDFGLWSWSRRGHLGPDDRPLDTCVRDLVAERSGRRPLGPIRLLTQPRVLGFVFNPVSFYYCFDEHDRELEVVVAEITNTPWHEQHCYVLSREASVERGAWRFRFAKSFHVSPFFPMEHEYDWSFTEPGSTLGVHMRNFARGERVFDATLTCERRALDGRQLARFALLAPAMSTTGLAAIYWQALRLKLKGAPFHEHPKHRVPHDSTHGPAPGRSTP